MTAPERIYLTTNKSDGEWSNVSQRTVPDWLSKHVDEHQYIRTDIHEAEIGALKTELAALKEGPDYKGVLFALCASLSLEDTIGDVWEDVIEALDQAGICADIGNMDEFQDVLKILPKPVMTLYGPVDEEDL